MKITDTKLPGVKIIEPRVFGDSRGFFMESWNKKQFADAGLPTEFVQDNHRYTSVFSDLRPVGGGTPVGREPPVILGSAGIGSRLLCHIRKR